MMLARFPNARINFTKFSLIFSFIALLNFVYLSANEDEQPNDRRCGTFSFIHNSKIRNSLQKKINFDPTTGRPKYHDTQISPYGKFKIHYDTSGVHQTELEDMNGNSVPDFVDSVAFYADSIYKIEVEQFGLPSPIGVFNPIYSIYLQNIGDGDTEADSNGFRDEGGMYGLTINDIEVYPNKYSSFIVIDNDFSKSDSARPEGGNPFPTFKTNGIEAMKITVAHEFNHAIQFITGFDDSSFSTVAEMLSVSFEEICFPEVNDYMQYVRSLFKNSLNYNFSSGSPTDGYYYSIFMIMLYQKYGKPFYQKYFEFQEKRINSYAAIDSSLHYLNSTIETEWHSLLEWIYHTNYRAIDGKYFNDAKEMPLLGNYEKLQFNSPSTNFSGAIEPFQFRADQIYFSNPFPLSNDTLNLITSYFDPKSFYTADKMEDKFVHSICKDEQLDYTKIFANYSQPYYHKLSSEKSLVFARLFEIPGVYTNYFANAYPSPFLFNEHDVLYFPAPEKSPIGKTARLTIYNSNLIEEFSFELEITDSNKNRILPLNLKAHLNSFPSASGVYLFKAENEDGQIIGKFSIINNKN